MIASAAASAVFAALGDPTRLQLLDWLASGEGRTATQLAGMLPISRQAVAKHLEVLNEAGVVESVRVGRETRYEVNATGLDPATAWLERRSAAWDRRLAALAEHVEGRPVAVRDEPQDPTRP